MIHVVPGPPYAAAAASRDAGVPWIAVSWDGPLAPEDIARVQVGEDPRMVRPDLKPWVTWRAEEE